MMADTTNTLSERDAAKAHMARELSNVLRVNTYLIL